METKTAIVVPQKDIDSLGHVNNSHYVTYLGMARHDWYQKAGLSTEEKRSRNIGTVIRKLEILYHKEAVLGDKLYVITRPFRLGNTSFIFKQDIFNQFDEHITEATVTSVMFDTTLRTSIKVLDEIGRHFSS